MVLSLQCFMICFNRASVLCSPPCSMWSRARHVPLGKNGPRPLRTRDAPFSCIADRTEKERRACDVGSTLAWICCYPCMFGLF